MEKKTNKEQQEKIEKITKRYIREIQSAMQRFANEICDMELNK